MTVGCWSAVTQHIHWLAWKCFLQVHHCIFFSMQSCHGNYFVFCIKLPHKLMRNHFWVERTRSQDFQMRAKIFISVTPMPPLTSFILELEPQILHLPHPIIIFPCMRLLSACIIQTSVCRNTVVSGLIRNSSSSVFCYNASSCYKVWISAII